jgi:hypothetical protein
LVKSIKNLYYDYSELKIQAYIYREIFRRGGGVQELIPGIVALFFLFPTSGKNLYYGYSALKPGYCIIILKFYDTNIDHFFHDIFMRFFFYVIFPGFEFYDT